MDQSKGYNIDNGMFELKLNPPQNFAAVQTDRNGPKQSKHIHSSGRLTLHE